MRAFLAELVRRRNLVVLALAVVGEFLYDLHTLAMTKYWWVTANWAAVALVFSGLVGLAWLADAKTWAARLALATCTAIGVCIGTTASMLVCR